MKSYGSIYKQELLKEIIPFWEKYSPDYTYGGYFTCLNSEGKVYDTDKFVWLQAREAWMFATLEYSSLNGNHALGKPTNPTSARTLSSRVICISFPVIPG